MRPVVLTGTQWYPLRTCPTPPEPLPFFSMSLLTRGKYVWHRHWRVLTGWTIFIENQKFLKTVLVRTWYRGHSTKFISLFLLFEPLECSLKTFQRSVKLPESHNLHTFKSVRSKCSAPCSWLSLHSHWWHLLTKNAVNCSSKTSHRIQASSWNGTKSSSSDELRSWLLYSVGELTSIPKQTPKQYALTILSELATPHYPHHNTRTLTNFCAGVFLLLWQNFIYFCTHWDPYPTHWPTNASEVSCSRTTRLRTIDWPGLFVFMRDTFACLWKW